jgi:hypothetical protein
MITEVNTSRITIQNVYAASNSRASRLIINSIVYSCRIMSFDAIGKTLDCTAIIVNANLEEPTVVLISEISSTPYETYVLISIPKDMVVPTTTMRADISDKYYPKYDNPYGIPLYGMMIYRDDTEMTLSQLYEA